MRRFFTVLLALVLFIVPAFAEDEDAAQQLSDKQLEALSPLLDIISYSALALGDGGGFGEGPGEAYEALMFALCARNSLALDVKPDENGRVTLDEGKCKALYQQLFGEGEYKPVSETYAFASADGSGILLDTSALPDAQIRYEILSSYFIDKEALLVDLDLYLEDELTWSISVRLRTNRSAFGFGLASVRLSSSYTDSELPPLLSEEEEMTLPDEFAAWMEALSASFDFLGADYLWSDDYGVYASTPDDAFYMSLRCTVVEAGETIVEGKTTETADGDVYDSYTSYSQTQPQCRYSLTLIYPQDDSQKENVDKALACIGWADSMN
ncbi:MAG: hypothetical protein PHI27_06215 [Eubacteriales bacterium]|nr:hypothetical protein [Eubacteriales bacterium]MDD3881828.1 hypothetical protein [Eubacteriales bacterium]MDD4512926.1 hypothetical protein [Eubacteriales bacterium]